MPKQSAGLLPYRRRDGVLEVLLVHPGGPFWARRDAGAWSIAKGEYESDEEPLHAARREFAEETGFHPAGEFVPLSRARQSGGKIVDAWAVECDWDPVRLESNTFSLEWPRGSGTMREFPEVDRAAWFEWREALRRILPGQRSFIEELHRRLNETA